MFTHPRLQRFALLCGAALLAVLGSLGDTHYVAATNVTPAAPYTDWATAATNIQDAVDVAADGDTVLVGDGVYRTGGRAVCGTMTNRVAVTKAVTVQSIGGPGVTLIEGQGPLGDGAIRCAYLTNNAVLAGFTLSNGYTQAGQEVYACNGGGVWCETGAVVSNCLLSGNCASSSGGGALGGTLYACTVIGNQSLAVGGGVAHSTLYNCLVWGNLTEHYGGGSYECALINCTVVNNAVEFWRPLVLSGESGSYSQVAASAKSVIIGELYPFAGGGAYGGTLLNCIVIDNDVFDGQRRYQRNCDFLTALHSCTLPVLPGEGNMGCDPLLVGANDYHLQAGSPCINVGSNQAWMTGSLDLEGQPRNRGGAVDFGAYESSVVGLPPRISKRSPTGNPAPVTEGAAIGFSVTADDSKDPLLDGRGMSNIVWYVDGVMKRVTLAGVPGALTSRFVLRTDAATVLGVAFRDFEIKAVALDRRGASSETSWSVRVNNVPAEQTIIFKPFPVKVLGAPDFEPNVTVSSGLPVTFASSNESVAQIVNGQIHIVGAGEAAITVSQQDNVDFKSKTARQTLTVKARLDAEIPSGGGTVTGTGLFFPGAKVALSARSVIGNTFLRWEDGSQTTTRRLIMPNTNMMVRAWFAVTSNVPPPAVGDPGSQRAMVGVPYNRALAIASDSLPTVTVAGLPAGLYYSAAARTVAGIPTTPVSNRTVVVTAKNVNKSPTLRAFTLTVEPLSPWAQGAFYGACGTDAHGAGLASMTVTPLGRATGRVSLRGTNFTFSATSYANRDEAGLFWLTTTAKVGSVSMPLTLSVRATGVLSRADGALGGGGWATLYRSVWRDAGMAGLAASYAGYYTASLPGTNDYGSGYLLLTADKMGGVKTAGKLADGESVSLSGSLILDEAGRVWTVLSATPRAYRGGGLFGVAEFFESGEDAKIALRALDGVPFCWENLNASAAREYKTDFHRRPCIDGGWYDTIGNLYRFYAGKELTVGTESMPIPEILAGTNRYGSACWNPDGIALRAVTNSQGVMTGLAAPKVDTPVKTDGSYDYENPTNAVGLTLAWTRATGVFKGNFKAWFDYGITHNAKTISYEGVLTPGRSDMSDGSAGRGFFLLSNEGQNRNAYDNIKPYSFSWSYDLKILLSE